MVKLKFPGSAFIGCLLVLIWAPQAQAEIKVSIDRNPVQVNESFQLVFSLDQNPDREPDFSVLQRDFIVLGNNRSSSISIINGEYQRSIKYTLQLMARQIGEFTVPAVRFDHELSKPFQVTVKPSSLSSVPQDQLLLEVLADKSEAYVQSQVILTLRLLSATNISAYQFGDISIEKLDAVVEPMGDVRQYQTRIADKSYLVLEKQFALFPQQSGRLEIAPVLAEVRLPSRSKFDPFQTGGDIRRLRSDPLYVDVDPIPADYVAPYWLPANRLELRENWQGDLTGLVAGEPITRSLTLIADGLTAAQLPELALSSIAGIKQYPDQPGLENSRSNDGIRGKREQKVALIPGTEGIYRVPQISVPWWNLQTGKMETATLPARELIVHAATATTPPTEIPAVAPAPGPVAATPAARGNRFWLWLSLLLACGWAASAVYWWLDSRRQHEPRTRTHEHVSLRKARTELQRACREGDAVAARQALLEWGQALLAPREIRNLHQLCTCLGAELGRQVRHLNQSLYASSHETWRGDELSRLCQQLEADLKRRKPEQTELMPLNPAG